MRSLTRRDSPAVTTPGGTLIKHAAHSAAPLNPLAVYACRSFVGWAYRPASPRQPQATRMKVER